MRVPLRYRATLLIFALTLAAVGSKSAVGTWNMQRLMHQRHADETRAEAHSFAYAVQLALAVKNRGELERLARSFASEAMISFVAIYHADAADPLALRVHDARAWAHYLATGEADAAFTVASRPVVLAEPPDEALLLFDLDVPGGEGSLTDARPIGRVVLGRSTAPISAAMRQQVLVTAIATAAAVGLSAAGMFLALSPWSRRLNKLVAASESLSRGDFDCAVPEADGDEIGRLAGAFNHMRRALRQRDRDLHELNATLQQRVERRTADLAVQRKILRDIIDNIPHYVFWKDRSGAFQGGNRNFARLVGLDDPQQLHGLTAADLLADRAMAERFMAVDEQVMRTNQPVLMAEEQFTHADGTELYLLVSKVPMCDETGRVVGMLGILADNTERRRIAMEQEQMRVRFAEASRQAGMAEVATSVLHNVGNVLNSVNVSSVLIADQLRDSRLPALSKSVRLLEEHRGELDRYLESDERGRKLLPYLHKLADLLGDEQARVIREAGDLARNIEHIKQIVAMQQSLARSTGAVEPVAAAELLEDAIRISTAALDRHHVPIERHIAPDLPPILTDRHKVIQILVNLISNARHALREVPTQRKRLIFRIERADDQVHISVTDNGIGISAENLTRVFNYGFTTRSDGHGFGLPHGALAARELGGALTAHSDGPGRGATFTLSLPIKPVGVTP